MKSNMIHSFSQVPSVKTPRAKFDRSCNYKTTLDAAELIPFFVDEALPGDTFSGSVNIFARLATPIFPIMDNMKMDVHFFAVPNRLLWSNWEKFCGAQDNPADSIDFTIPTVVASGGYAIGSLGDYFGLPAGKAKTVTHNVLPYRAYNLIWNQWYRDQNLQDSVVINVDNGPDTITDYALLKRCKRHDYFTACLPWPQKGSSVSLPLGTSAPINSGATVTQNIGVYSDAVSAYRNMDTAGGAGDAVRMGGTPVASGQALYADLTAATAATINQLRQAFQVQKMLERDARGGTRYTELILSHFGVRSDDARLQRPEYLGGGTINVNVNPIGQTSSTDATTPQGNLAAIGTVAGGGIGFTKSFTEHCYVIGLVSVRADLNYQQGLDRMWSRSTRNDFYWPALAQIGEQAVLNKEIWFNADANDDLVFGYQERYGEYRYKPSKITGEFRSDAGGSLDAWHLAQDFTTLPVLGNTFITENPPIDRIVAVSGEKHFLFDSFIQLHCTRPMPVYGVPGFIDHF